MPGGSVNRRIGRADPARLVTILRCLTRARLEGAATPRPSVGVARTCVDLTVDRPRIVSAILALLFVIAAACIGPPDKMALQTAMFLALPLAFIWFGDEIGSYTGWWRGHYIDKPTPGCLLRVIGWALLFTTPIAIYGFKMRQAC